MRRVCCRAPSLRRRHRRASHCFAGRRRRSGSNRGWCQGRRISWQFLRRAKLREAPLCRKREEGQIGHHRLLLTGGRRTPVQGRNVAGHICICMCMYVYTYTHTYTSMSGGVPTLDGGTSPPCEEPVGSDLPFLSLATEGRFSEFRLSEKLPRFIDLGTSPFLTRFSFFSLQNDGSSSRAAAAGSASCTTHTYVRTAMHACMHACLLAYIQTYIQTDRPPRARHPAPHAPR